MDDHKILYFRNEQEWRIWLSENYNKSKGEFLLFYRLDSGKPTMRWEEAVKVALCFGWIDSTVKKIDKAARKQRFSPRKAKSVWSKVNKNYIEELIANNLMHESGMKCIELAKQNGSWESLDQVENLELPDDLQMAFNANLLAAENFSAFSKTYRKSYLHWLYQAKRKETRDYRIAQIVRLSAINQKTRE